MKRRQKKLNIAQMHWGFPPLIGGVETHLTILLPEMVRMGHNVSLLTAPAEGAKAEDTYKGVHVTRTPLMNLNWLYRRGMIGLEKEIMKSFKKFVEKTKPDVIHVHNLHYFSKVHAKALEKISVKKGIPIILTAHNIWDDLLFVELTRDIKWTHIIAVSYYVKKEIIGIAVDHRKITVVHHGIDEKIYSPDIKPGPIYKKYPRLKGRRVLFHPARMGLAKGCDVSIKALPLIKKRFPNIMLVLAGVKNIIDWGETQQKDIAYMVDLINSLGLRDNVLIDAFQLTDMPRLYAASDVCVYPSTACEPFGLTMLEALSSGKPMVVTNTGGMPEIIKDGINGFVVPIKDFEGLSSRVVLLLEDDELRDRFGYTGREIIERQYTKEVVARNTLHVYRKYL